MADPPGGVAPEPFIEDDRAATALPYDDGGVPAFVWAAWAAILAGYIAYMAVYGMPDLLTWGLP